MKNKSKELDVDFIGGQGPLTQEEELAISEFIKAKKDNQKIPTATKADLTKRSKATA